MGVFDPIRSSAESQGFLIEGFSAQVTGRCSCGSNIAIVVHLIPGADVKGMCPACKATFRVARMVYDAKLDIGKLNVAVETIKPSIIQPATSMPRIRVT